MKMSAQSTQEYPLIFSNFPKISVLNKWNYKLPCGSFDSQAKEDKDAKIAAWTVNVAKEKEKNAMENFYHTAACAIEAAKYQITNLHTITTYLIISIDTTRIELDQVEILLQTKHTTYKSKTQSTPQ